MPSMILNPTVSSYQYENYIFSQQNNCTPLPLYCIQDSHSYSVSNLVINISSDSIDLSLIMLTNVLLELPIGTFRPNDQYFNNQLTITSYYTSDTHATYEVSRVNQSISSASFYGDKLFLNITTLLQHWDQKASPIYQLVISVQNPNFYLEINNNEYVFPMIHIRYENQSLSHNDTSKTCMLYLLETHCMQLIVPPLQPFVFDPACPEFAVDILYDEVTGFFSFTIPGLYYLHWILNIHGSSAISTISIGVLNKSTGDITTFACPCVLPGQVYGQLVIHITETPIEYALINDCESALQLCNISTQSSLMIYKL